DRDPAAATRGDVCRGRDLSHLSDRHQHHRGDLRGWALGVARPDAPRCDDPRRGRRPGNGAGCRHPRLAPVHDRLLPWGVARRLRRCHRRADPLGLSRARSGDAAAGPRGRHPRRQRQSARLVRRQLRRRLPLQLRAGDVSRARLRRALSADAPRPGGAASGPLRAADDMKPLAVAVAIVILAALPSWVGGTYYVNVASQILLYAVFALGVNVLVGYAGLVTLGHAGLFGIAAYTGARMLTGGHGHVAAIAAALVVTLTVGAIFAALSLRGTGLGFVMITVALGQIVWGIAYRWISV